MVIEEKRYTIDEVFNLIGKEYLERNDARWKRKINITVDGFEVYPISLRYMTFYQKGTACACCGRQGTHFKLCGEPDTNRRHFNLYTDDGVLMTKDHIIPASKGGPDFVSNFQTMCEICNAEKGNSHPTIKVKYIVANNAYENKKTTFRDIKKAAKHMVLNYINPPAKDKNKIVDCSIAAVCGIQEALKTGSIYCGFYWSEEER